MQGGDKCEHDYMMVDHTGDTMYGSGHKYCGLNSPVVISNSTRMTIMFKSDDLFRYQGEISSFIVSILLNKCNVPGFSCRYRALLPDGNAAPGTFGNDTTGHGQGLSSNNFLQVVQCPSNTPVTTKDPATGMETTATSGMNGAASLYSGNWDGRCGNQNSLPGLPPGKSHRV